MFKKEVILDDKKLTITLKYGEFVYTYFASDSKHYYEKSKILKDEKHG